MKPLLFGKYTSVSVFLHFNDEWRTLREILATPIYKIPHTLKQAIHSIEPKFPNSSKLSWVQKLALSNNTPIIHYESRFHPKYCLLPTFRHDGFIVQWARETIREQDKGYRKTPREIHGSSKITKSFRVPSEMCTSCSICTNEPLMNTFSLRDISLSIDEFHFSVNNVLCPFF